MEIEFSWQIFEKCQISWPQVQWEPSCCMGTDGQTGMTQPIVTFPNYANAPQYIYLFVIYLALWKRTKSNTNFPSNSPQFTKGTAWLESSQLLPACPSGTNGTKTKMNVKYWWEDSDKRKQKLYEQHLSATLVSSTCQQHLSATRVPVAIGPLQN